MTVPGFACRTLILSANPHVMEVSLQPLVAVRDTPSRWRNEKTSILKKQKRQLSLAIPQAAHFEQLSAPSLADLSSLTVLGLPIRLVEVFICAKSIAAVFETS